MNSRVDAIALQEGGAPPRSRPVRRPQRRHEVRVRQEADVEQQVGVDRHAVLEAEAEERDDQPRARRGRATAP